MSFLKSAFPFDEEFLEPVARYFRFQIGMKHLPQTKSLVVVDLGCGPKIRFYQYLLKKKIQMKKYIAVDPLMRVQFIKSLQQKNGPSIKRVIAPLKKKIPLLSKTADIVVAFAFIEHITYPKEIILDAIRVLRPGGSLILTSPTPRAKSLLEFLAFRLHLISTREIAEHKNYFDKKDFLDMIPKNQNVQFFHQYFEGKLNNLLVLTVLPKKKKKLLQKSRKISAALQKNRKKVTKPVSKSKVL
jgi:SAM-dependent methyltransferase